MCAGRRDYYAGSNIIKNGAYRYIQSKYVYRSIRMFSTAVVHVNRSYEEAPLMSMKGLMPSDSFRLPAPKIDPGVFVSGVMLPVAQLLGPGPLPAGITISPEALTASFAALPVVPAADGFNLITDTGEKVVLKRGVSAFGTLLDFYVLA